MKLLKKGITMNFSKKTFVVAGLAAAVALAGCSSDNPDEGTNISKTSISGTAVDGYIAGATVYVDNNNNGRKNAGESTAITDKDGYFSTAKDGTDYCADDATSIQKLHCLKVAGLETGAVVRTFGGYDLFTGEPFTGSLAAKITVGDDGIVANQMVSPLTSLLVDADPTVHSGLLGIFGLDGDDLNIDFLDEDIYGLDVASNSTILNSAIKLHKIVTLFSEVFIEQYKEFGQETSFPDTPNAIVYKALVDSMMAQEDLNLDPLSSISLTTAFDAAQTAIRALYDKDGDLSAPSGSASGAALVQNALDIINVIDNAIPVSTSFADVKSRVIGVEAIVKKMVDGDDVTDAIVKADSIYSALDSALLADDIDFTALTEVDYSAATPDFTDITIVNNDSFTELANKQLHINVNYGGKRGEGYFFFNSTAGASRGKLNVCLGYDDGVGGDPKFEETDGVLLEGTWLALDDTKLILNLAGSLSLALLDKGMKNGEHRYSLNYGGEVRSWTSDNGLLGNLEGQSVPEDEQPTDDKSCAELLDFNNNPV